MDTSNRTAALVFLIIYISCVSGRGVPQLDRPEVKILDGEIIVFWKPPEAATSKSHYNVQMAKYTGQWAAVASCTGITRTYCDLSGLIYDYAVPYKVRVQLVAGDKVSEWAARKVVPNTSELQPPSFTLWATSSTLIVYVHPKPILREIFLYGLTYTIYLEERGPDIKNTTAYLKDDVGEDQRVKTFSSLHWGREYCVSVKVETNAALSRSSVSPKQCLVLPEQEWYITAVSSISILSVLTVVAIVAAVLQCYLKRQEKTPVALKSPVSGWLPLTVGEGPMEVVTDRGWFLSTYRTELKDRVRDPVTHVTVTEDTAEEDRRTSTDSGVVMESNSAANSGGSPSMRQEDSGCGSLGGAESTTSSQTEYPVKDGRTDDDVVRRREDSGVGLGCQLDSSSLNMDVQDSGSLKEAVAGGDYRSQSPAAGQIHVCGEEEAFKQTLPGSILAEVVSGYRAGPQSCICSGAGQCTWCHKQGHYGTPPIKQYRPVSLHNGLLSGKCDFMDSFQGGVTFSSYSQKAHMDTVTVEDLDTTFIQLGETFPLLTSLSPLPVVDKGQDLNMNNVSLSLCDVQLTTD